MTALSVTPAARAIRTTAHLSANLDSVARPGAGTADSAGTAGLDGARAASADIGDQKGIIKRWLHLGKAQAHDKTSKMESKYADKLLEKSADDLIKELHEFRQGVVAIGKAKAKLQNQGRALQEQHRSILAKQEKAAELKPELLPGLIKAQGHLETQMQSLSVTFREMEAQEAELREAFLERKMELQNFNIAKDAKLAQLEAVTAQEKISKSVTGIGGAASDAAKAVKLVDDRIANSKANIESIKQNVEEGVLDDVIGGDAVEKALQKAELESGMEDTVAKIQQRARDRAAGKVEEEVDLFASSNESNSVAAMVGAAG